MNLKNRFFRLVLLISVPTLCGFPGWIHAARSSQPNIIFLLTDDQRWDTLGVYGNSIIRTPNLDRLGRQGVVFENMFVTTSICAPSRASIFTGQYVSRHGVWDFRKELTPEQLSQSYPGMLKRAGYRLGFVGKWGVGKPPAGLFDYNKGFPGQGKYWMNVEGKPRHLTSVMGDQALEFLDGCSPETPFCLSVSFKAPHVQDSYDLRDDSFPFDPALEALYADITIPPPETAACEYFNRLPNFLQNSENRMRWAVRFWGPARYQESVKGYYRLISGVDVVVGRILEKLEERGFSENTVILFTGDNGFFLGEYGFAGKWLPHEVSIRVPLLIYDPRLRESLRGVRRSEMVLSIDMAPTILGLAEIEIPQQMQGHSLVPLLKGQQMDWRSEFFYEHLFKGAGRIPKTEAVRTERWKYIRYVETNPVYEEFYDLQRDPDEKHNLASKSEYRDILAQLRGKWQKWRRKIR